MKTYKTWELLKMAEEYDYDNCKSEIEDRPQFQLVDDSTMKVTFARSFNGSSLVKLESTIVGEVCCTNEEWVAVHKQVDWKDALEENLRGDKVVYFVFNGSTYELYTNCFAIYKINGKLTNEENDTIHN